MRLRLRPDRSLWPAYDIAAHRATIAQGRAAYRAHIAGQPYHYFPDNTRLADWFREGWQKEQEAQQQKRWEAQRKAHEDALIASGKDFALQPPSPEDPAAWTAPRWV
jgi:hypothetical protein